FISRLGRGAISSLSTRMAASTFKDSYRAWGTRSRTTRGASPLAMASWWSLARTRIWAISRSPTTKSKLGGGQTVSPESIDHFGEVVAMKGRDAAKRREFLKEAVLSAGAALWSGTFFQRFAAADEKKPPVESAPIGRRELVKGLDGMSRVADPGNDPF